MCLSFFFKIRIDYYLIGNTCAGQRKRSNMRRDVMIEMRSCIRHRKEMKQKEEKRLKREEIKNAQLAAQQEMLDWEARTLAPEPMKSIIKYSWEV